MNQKKPALRTMRDITQYEQCAEEYYRPP